MLVENRLLIALVFLDENRGPRIPDYDDYVLDYASANIEFTLKMEKQLAEWVADTSKPTLRYAPDTASTARLNSVGSHRFVNISMSSLIRSTSWWAWRA